METLPYAAFPTLMGQRRRCPACGKDQVINRLDKDKRYHCKSCGRPFRGRELAERIRERR